MSNVNPTHTEAPVQEAPDPQPQRLHDRRSVRGVAEYAGVDANLVRLLAVLGTIFGFGSILVVYVVAWLLMPQD